MNSQNNIRRLLFAAVCLALCMILPMITMNIPAIGNALSPMHIPVLLCGFICGPWYGLAVGLIAPVMRSALFGMPAMFPQAVAMSFELATYGILTGIMYMKLPKTVPMLYAALIIAMIGGRIVWGAARAILSGVSGSSFTWALFFAGAFTNAIPGIILHILIIPPLVLALKKAKIME